MVSETELVEIDRFVFQPLDISKHIEMMDSK